MVFIFHEKRVNKSFQFYKTSQRFVRIPSTFSFLQKLLWTVSSPVWNDSMISLSRLQSDSLLTPSLYSPHTLSTGETPVGVSFDTTRNLPTRGPSPHGRSHFWGSVVHTYRWLWITKFPYLRPCHASDHHGSYLGIVLLRRTTEPDSIMGFLNRVRTPVKVITVLINERCDTPKFFCFFTCK